MYLNQLRKEKKKKRALIKLEKNTTNSNIALTLTEKVTLSSPVFLFEFTNDMSLSTSYYVISADTSTETQRYNLFEITEGVDDPENGSVILGLEGFYKYNVYEQATGSTNLDPTGLTLVESGKMRLGGTTQTFVKNEISNEYIAHNPSV